MKIREVYFEEKPNTLSFLWSIRFVGENEMLNESIFCP